MGGWSFSTRTSSRRRWSAPGSTRKRRRPRARKPMPSPPRPAPAGGRRHTSRAGTWPALVARHNYSEEDMHRTLRLAALAALLVPLLAAGGAAQTAADDSLLTRANQARRKGAEAAPITIIELADFQCPYCRQFNQATMPAL